MQFMQMLYLTAEEQATFQQLPEGLREGWQVETVSQVSHESQEERMMRYALVKLRDPSLLAFVEKVREAQSDDTVASLLQETDLSNVSDADLTELFFAIGPQALTAIITSLLAKAETDDDLQDIAALTIFRHTQLVA